MPSVILNDVIRKIGIASVLAMSPLAANAANINLAVANTFYGNGNSGGYTSPIADIIAAFQAANPTDTVTIVDQGQPPTLKSQITGGNGLNVDLFLSADPTQPDDLYTNHPSLVVGMPFNYASGALAFWSNTINTGRFSPGQRRSLPSSENRPDFEAKTCGSCLSAL